MEEGMSISISNHFDCEESTEIIDAKKPKSWNIINALNWVLVHAEDFELSDWFWKTSQDALDYLNRVRVNKHPNCCTCLTNRGRRATIMAKAGKVPESPTSDNYDLLR